MARSLQLLSRAGALCSLSTLTLSRSRFISKGANIQPWGGHSQPVPRHRDEVSDGAHELEDVEDKLQRAIKKEMQRAKTVKYHILRRKMTPPGPPERKLTWDAMEEIRHLKQEQPEEWTVDRLAEGFSVSKDTIFRVLRSKFIPNPERKVKQDIKVMAKLQQQMLPSGHRAELEKHRLTSGPTQKALSSGSENSALISVGRQSLIPQNKQNHAAVSVVTKQQFSEITQHSPEMTRLEMHQSTERTAIEEEEAEEEEEDEGWDGQVFSEDDIEELITMKATAVIEKGNEIFDVEGNFLYRI